MISSVVLEVHPKPGKSKAGTRIEVPVTLLVAGAFLFDSELIRLEFLD
jgi:hypothetical protein